MFKVSSVQWLPVRAISINFNHKLRPLHILLTLTDVTDPCGIMTPIVQVCRGPAIRSALTTVGQRLRETGTTVFIFKSAIINPLFRARCSDEEVKAT